jgi:hypothetical protein
MTLFLCILLGLLYFNNILGFTYYLEKGNRFSRLKEASEVLQDTTLSKDERAVVMKMRNDILMRENITQKATSWMATFYSSIKRPNADSTSVSSSITSYLKKHNKSGVWLYLTGGILFWLVFGYAVYDFFWGSEIRSVTVIIQDTLSLIFMLILGYLSVKLLGSFPIIYRVPASNYALNLILNGFLMALILWLQKLNEKHEANRTANALSNENPSSVQEDPTGSI